jgi:sigma-54 dependent transcriptional regulator, acetoin dehydrogenase operon transcriptional activator AcoR
LIRRLNLQAVLEWGEFDMVSQFLSKDVWQRFVREGVLDPYRLHRNMCESWLRCRRIGVNPYSGNGREILSGEELRKKKAENATFLEVATPHLKSLYHSVRGTGAMVLLTDEDGYVISAIGDAGIVQKAKEINFVEGVRWTENEVGTNAIGNALISNEPMLLVGCEHYAVASHDWSCAAAPIHDADGHLRGVIDLSGPVEAANVEMLGAVAMTAYAIEQDWRSREQSILLELLRESSALLRHPNVTHTVIMDRKHRIIGVSRDIDWTGSRWFQKPLDWLLAEGYTVAYRQPVTSRSPRHGEPSPIPELLGYRVSVLPSERRVTSTDSPCSVHHFPGEVGVSDVFGQLLRDACRVARMDTSVFISGESGTGKELIARTIHKHSLRSHGPFVALNCGAIPDNLMESELFGYTEGAFTGARKGGYKGKLQQAHGGTLFLDEVEAMPEAMQVALLRVLQEREVVPIGGNKPVALDFRLIAASNRDLWELVKTGQFREDLYYRIHVYPLHVPPLRSRKEDIPHLVRYYCMQRNWPIDMPVEIIHRLMNHDWPGNVRELFNVLEQIRIHADGGRPNITHVPQWLEDAYANREDQTPQTESQDTKVDALSCRQRLQKTAMLQALEQTGGNVTKAAQLLNIPRSTFYRRIRKFGL